LKADTDWLEALGEHSRVVQSVRFFEGRVRAAESLEIEVVLPSTAPLDDPGTLKSAAKFIDAISEVDRLGPATSILDLIGRLNRLLHDDDPAFEHPGETRAANAEILELISFDDPGVLESWLNFDRSRFRISVEAPPQSYSSRGEVLESVRSFARSELPSDWGVHLSGEYAIDFDWIRDVQQTQLRSFPIALALVFAMVALFFRSIRLAFAATVPTLLPVVVTLGVMGWVGMSLDVGRAMIAAILIGIGVDDSIHLLDHYKVRRAAGADPREAIRRAMLHVGRAVVTTSLALSLGFLTLMASAWQTISSFGFFVALAILGALASALFVLPALLFAFSSGERASDPRPS
jgi:predicted RND superfamily exporter protein